MGVVGRVLALVVGRAVGLVVVWRVVGLVVVVLRVVGLVVVFVGRAVGLVVVCRVVGNSVENRVADFVVGGRVVAFVVVL